MFNKSRNTGSWYDALPRFGLLEAIHLYQDPQVVVAEGTYTHQHQFEQVRWDTNRLGPSVTNLGQDFSTPLEFPVATFLSLHRCFCGREVLRSVLSVL